MAICLWSPVANGALRVPARWSHRRRRHRVSGGTALPPVGWIAILLQLAARRSDRRHSPRAGKPARSGVSKVPGAMVTTRIPDCAAAMPDGLARASQNLRPGIARPIAVSAIDASCGPRNSLTSQRSTIGHEACARGRGVECLIHLSAAPAPAGRPPPTGARSLRDASHTGGGPAGRPGPTAFR